MPDRLSLAVTSGVRLSPSHDRSDQSMGLSHRRPMDAFLYLARSWPACRFGRQYGLYVEFSPDLRRGRSTITGSRAPTPRYTIRGRASVCTKSGLKIPFDLRGDV